MEFAIALVIQGLGVKEERDFDIMYGACLSRSLFIIFTENALGPHLNLDYYCVLSNWVCVGRDIQRH